MENESAEESVKPGKKLIRLNQSGAGYKLPNFANNIQLKDLFHIKTIITLLQGEIRQTPVMSARVAWRVVDIKEVAVLECLEVMIMSGKEGRVTWLNG